MIDTTKLRELAQAAEGYGSCKYAWPHDEHDGVAVVGQIHDSEKYPVAEIDTGQYFANEEAIKLAGFYAAANPATVLALVDELDGTESMFLAACADLGAINKLLGLDPDDGGAEPILYEVKRLLAIEAAARNLAKVKGRHHSEQAMNQLLEALK